MIVTIDWFCIRLSNNEVIEKTIRYRIQSLALLIQSSNLIWLHMTSFRFCKNKEKKQKLHLLFNCLQLILLPKRQLTKRYASFNRVFPLMQISIGSVIIILMGIHEIGVICTSSYVFRFVVPKPCLIVAINVANYLTFLMRFTIFSM